MSEEEKTEQGLLNTTMSRKGFVAMTGAAGLGAFLAACGGSSSDSGSSSAAGGDAAASGDAAEESASGAKFDPASEPDGPIEIFTWAGYDDSPKDGAPFMWEQYKSGEYASKSPLKFTFLEDDAQALSKVASGYNPDIIHPCIAYTQQWKDAGLIQPLDMSLLPDFEGIPEAIYQGGVIDGQKYMVPFDVGFSCLTYDADQIEFPDGEETWAVLLDSKYKGKMALFSDNFAIIKIGFLINNGAKDPNVQTSEDIAAAKETALKIKPNLRNYWTSQTDTVNDFVNGNLIATYTWPDGYWKIKNHPKMKDRNIKYMQPKEGRLAWVCGMVLNAQTQKPGRCEVAMASANTPAAGAALTDNFQYSSAQQKGVADLIQDKALVSAFQIDDPSAWAPPKAWFEAPLPNFKEFSDAGAEVKNA